VQSIDIPLTGGINDAIDEYLTQPGQALVLTNVRNNEEGGAKKRWGTVAQSLATTTGATMGTGVRLGVWGDRLVITDDTNLYALTSSGFAPATNKLTIPRLEHIGLGVGLQSSTPTMDILYDSASDSYIAAWSTDPSGGAAPDVFSAVFDAATGAIKWGVQRVTTNGDCISPRLCKTTGFYAVTWVRTGTGAVLMSAKTTVLSNWAAGTDITGGTACVTPFAFDASTVTGATNEIAVAYAKAAGATPIRAVKVTITAGPTITATASVNLADATVVEVRGIGIRCASGEFAWIGYGMLDIAPLGYLKVLSVNHGPWTAALATVTLAGGLGIHDINRVAVERLDSTHAYVLGSGLAAGTSTQSLFGADISSAGVFHQNISAARLSVGSKLTLRIDGRLLGWLVSIPKDPLTLGSAFFCEIPYSTTTRNYNVPRVMAAGPMRLVDTTTTGYERGPRVPNIEIPSTNFAYATSIPLARDLGGIAVAPQLITADFGDVTRSRGVQFGTAYYVSPMQMYDGERLSEISFLQDPECNALASLGGGGSLSAGSYSVVCVYKWIDSRGRVIRSAPSAPIAQTAVANDRLQLTAQILSLTEKQEIETTAGTPGLRFVAIEVYRTEVNGTVYYLDTSVANFRYSPNADGRFTVILSQSDVLLSANAALVQPSVPYRAPPNLRSLVVWQNRLCGIGPDGRTIWISSVPADTDQPTWNEAFNVVIPDAGELTALAVMDEKLVALSARRVWLVSGQAPDINGTNGNLTPTIISSEVGAVDDRGVVSFSGGVMFRGPDTFYLLDRGLTLQPVGLMVQDQAAAYPVVRAATVVARDRELRFECCASDVAESGITLVYHIGQNEWTQRTYYEVVFGDNSGFVSAAIANDTWYGLVLNGGLLAESRSTYLDSGTYVPMSVETPWIKVAGLQGFVRCQRAQVIYRPKTAATMRLQLFANGEATAFHDNTFTEAQIASGYGRVGIHLERQKIEMVKVIMTDSAPAVLGTGQGIEFAGLQLYAGVKKGAGKLIPASQKA